MTAPYLDIHTHRVDTEVEALSVKCLNLQELKSLKTYLHTSAGIHPWWVEDCSKDEIEELKKNILKLVGDKKLWAIGETGIDRAYPEFLEDQKELLDWHVDLSENHKLAMVIHSVRAGADFLQVIKAKRPTSPWIFHDFRGNETLMKDLLRLHPHCYFSFGLSLDNSPQIRELLPNVPLERLFLETDEQKHLNIHEIYIRAADQLKIDLEFLKSQIWMNYKRVGSLT